MSNRELRITSQPELRASGRKLTGTAIRYNSRSRFIPSISGYEMISPNAFTRSLEQAQAGQRDLSLNASHNETFLISSLALGGLEVRSDAAGLHFVSTVPRTDYGDAVLEAVRDGDMSKCSFGFQVTRQNYADDGCRLVQEGNLLHLTVCRSDLAAYEATSAEARSAGSIGYYEIGTYHLRSVKYLVTEDDGTQHLPVTGEDGKPDHHLMGAAWAALHGGYRGNKYEGPGKEKAIRKLVALYKSEGMRLPESGRSLGYDSHSDRLERELADAWLDAEFHRLGGRP